MQEAKCARKALLQLVDLRQHPRSFHRKAGLVFPVGILRQNRQRFCSMRSSALRRTSSPSFLLACLALVRGLPESRCACVVLLVPVSAHKRFAPGRRPPAGAYIPFA